MVRLVIVHVRDVVTNKCLRQVAQSWVRLVVYHHCRPCRKCQFIIISDCQVDDSSTSQWTQPNFLIFNIIGDEFQISCCSSKSPRTCQSSLTSFVDATFACVIIVSALQSFKVVGHAVYRCCRPCRCPKSRLKAFHKFETVVLRLFHVISNTCRCLVD